MSSCTPITAIILTVKTLLTLKSIKIFNRTSKFVHFYGLNIHKQVFKQEIRVSTAATRAR